MVLEISFMFIGCDVYFIHNMCLEGLPPGMDKDDKFLIIGL
jgi:hypothetical protein